MTGETRGEPNYVRGLEETIRRFLEPVRDVPLSVVVRVLTGHRVLKWDGNEESCRRLKGPLIAGVSSAARQMARSGVISDRPNEVGNRMEGPVRGALSKQGFDASTPSDANGKKQATGYPDILLHMADLPPVYLEVKSYNRQNVDTTQRAFYCSPPLSKVSLDAYHLVVAFEIEKRAARQFFPTAYRLLDIEGLRVDVKHEFNASNRDMYTTCPAIASGHL